MSAKAVTDDEGTGREAALRAIQEAAESVAGKKGVPKGPQGTKGIVVLSNDKPWSSPEDKKKKKWFDDDEEDEGSVSSSVHPRNLSYSSTSARVVPKSPSKRKKAAWPPRGPALRRASCACSSRIPTASAVESREGQKHATLRLQNPPRRATLSWHSRTRVSQQRHTATGCSRAYSQSEVAGSIDLGRWRS